MLQILVYWLPIYCSCNDPAVFSTLRKFSSLCLCFLMRKMQFYGSTARWLCLKTMPLTWVSHFTSRPNNIVLLPSVTYPISLCQISCDTLQSDNYWVHYEKCVIKEIFIRLCFRKAFFSTLPRQCGLVCLSQLKNKAKDKIWFAPNVPYSTSSCQGGNNHTGNTALFTFLFINTKDIAVQCNHYDFLWL